MKIYSSDDYKSILRSCLLEKKAADRAGYSFEKMAAACRIEKAYLSRTLNGDNHLSPDQLYLACQFLGLSKDEQNYLLLIHQYARSGLSTFKKELKVEIDSLRKRKHRTEGHIHAPVAEADTPDAIEYFLDPNAQIVHMLLGIERYAAAPDLIAGILRLSNEEIDTIISKLEKLNLIEFSSNIYRVLQKSLHLSSNSRWYRPYRVATRLKSLERIQNLPANKSYGFSVIFSSTKAVQEKILADFMQFLSRAEEAVNVGADEEVFQMNFDLFPWT